MNRKYLAVIVSSLFIFANFIGCSMSRQGVDKKEQLPEGKADNRIIKDKDKVKILDDEGNLVKEISLQPETIIEEEKIKRGEKTGRMRNIKKEIKFMSTNIVNIRGVLW